MLYLKLWLKEREGVNAVAVLRLSSLPNNQPSPNQKASCKHLILV